MSISNLKRLTILTFAALFFTTAMSLGAQQDNSREIKAVDLSLHTEVGGLAGESQQTLELLPEPIPSNHVPSQKIAAPDEPCPESSAKVHGGTNDETDKTEKETTPLSSWSVLPAAHPPMRQIGSDRAEVTPEKDCLPDRNPGSAFIRAHSMGPAPGQSNSSSTAHSRVLASPVGLVPEAESPLAEPFNRKQIAPSTDFSPTKTKIPKSRGPKKKPGQSKLVSPQVQDSFGAGDTMDVPEDKK